MNSKSWIMAILAISLSAGIPAVKAALSGSLAPDEIQKRILAVGEVKVEANSETVSTLPSLTPADIGKRRYEETCHMCHATGVAGAPKFADKSAWQKRLEKGMEVLHQHVKEGFKAMPAKGGCLSCSDEELQKALDYILSKAK